MLPRRPLRRVTAQINSAYTSAAGVCSRIHQSNFKRQPLGDEEALRMATASLEKLLYFVSPITSIPPPLAYLLTETTRNLRVVSFC
ncbi:hypothetical protein KL86DES1_10938 [uncultured Desulfovibrio sp.]|uniref:Uncharacterized protein n=1 Tax=uncultured Desulfovibrio sp. TaxID=167968 RepID=A0A212L115_9BACT|nr:hypothetical protein KL86DES1_10938 [uncultured Desulfovibrio sp.]VZH32809.1 conserved protein of unknown function [Desulfovibrio sp. 86]